MKPKIIHPEGWAHIGGQIGWDKNKTLVSNEFIGQMEQALTNIVEIVRAAGGDIGDIGRLTWRQGETGVSG